MVRRIMEKFRIDEISAVTKPAQKGARSVIMKRADDMSDTSCEDDEAAKGKKKMPVPAPKEAAKTPAEMDGSNPDDPDNEDGEDNENEDDAALEKEIDMTEQEAAELRALAAMNDTQKSYFATLTGEPKTAFIKMSVDQRAAAVANVNANDAIVYSSETLGKSYRKSDSPETVALAKMVDKMDGVLKGFVSKANDREVDDLVAKMDHLGKSKEDKRTMAKGILAIEDPTSREFAKEAVLAGREIVAALFKASGLSSAGPGILADENTQLNELAKARAEKDGTSFHKAYDAVLQTREGAKLYNQMVAPRH